MIGLGRAPRRAIRGGVLVLAVAASAAISGCETGQSTRAGSQSGADRATAASTSASPSTSSDATIADPSTSTPAAPTGSSATGAAGRAAPCPSGDALPAFGAVDLQTGAVLWSTCSPTKTYRDVLGATADVVIASESKQLGGSDTIGISAVDGAELWRISTASASAPHLELIGSDVVPVFTDAEGTPFVVGVDLATGNERWRLEPGGSVVATTPSLVVLGDSMTDPGSSATPGRLYAVDRGSGAPVWTSDVRYVSSGGGARLAATTTAELLVVPTAAGTTAVDLATGTVEWTAGSVGGLASANGVVVGSSTGSDQGLVAFDASTGAPLWEAAARPSYGGWLAIGDGVVVALSDGSQLVALDLRSGEPRWEVHEVRAEPQVIVGTTALLLWGGTLAAASTTDGSITWELTEPFNSPFMNAVATDGTAAFVAINSLPWAD